MHLAKLPALSSKKVEAGDIFQMGKIGLHWMRHDLRINDNWALSQLIQKVDKTVVVYVFNSTQEIENNYGFSSLGNHRKVFLQECLLEVANRLKQMNISFYCVRSDDPPDTISTLIEHWSCSVMSYEFHAGFHENQEVLKVKESHPSLQFIEQYSNYLFSPHELPFALDDMPNVFSPFRRKVEKNLKLQLTIPELMSEKKANNQPNTMLRLPDEITELFNGVLTSHSTDLNDINKSRYAAGESGAHARIEEYFFKSHGIAKYKETRNGLDGWGFSSRLSAYLAIGAISPRTVVEKLKEYESMHTANESTYWLFFELLWREFFHWQALKHGKHLFNFAGIQKKKPETNIDPVRFKHWIAGTTAYPIVNACMKQLAHTGFMSNRGRQLVASCFVHELGLDWRYGAAYFEHMLIDYDVASNYGNWQYLAGVGSDPRGHRQFNLQKQTEIYDPTHQFIESWLSHD
ncbi:DASH family cryptochrome [Glaciecola petra]|uniref:Cryptochrome DASH n=1 Tax=Glaciecola petra TaxID=3075602 RepID=A0ABU2ZPA1_9ALTE|nr:DASH family cryptochrome [Aestuariibacter sp. P117]MDT0594230.1 DASH family cryptochrome [Aestuariibacter sp. P117]